MRHTVVISSEILVYSPAVASTQPVGSESNVSLITGGKSDKLLLFAHLLVPAPTAKS